ncbi:MAG: S46 family peptidase [Ferruginibacter sp.]|nr:S46 family peptidase [Ferruginibacter sp.]
MKHSKILLLLIFITNTFIAKADEGMWLPQLLGKLNESRMKSLGMKISADDIYSINHGSLKDAVVSFGGFCTGEIISSKGLILTNHHCGFDAIQNHSSLEHNYIRDGFWSKTNAEEIPNKGLYATFIVRIDDVSEAAFAGITSKMSETERMAVIDKNLQQINKDAKKEATQKSFARGFFEGNKYYLFVTETYNDVRLVGAPPSAIGNFGKDTDNWVWPRHTGDFSMFRIYANKDNKPAEYAIDNVPYTPKKSLNISIDGIAENDFTMVFGFPGRTTEYLYSAAVEQIKTINDPAKIAIRDRALNIIDGFMRKDEGIKIQYAAKYASIQNAYKKWQGEVLGLTKTDGVGRKKMQELEFQKRVDANTSLKEKYGNLLQTLETGYSEIKSLGLARDYYQEIVSKIEIFTIVAQLNTLVSAYEKNGQKGFDEAKPKVKAMIEDFMKEFNPIVDKKLFEGLMEMYVKNQPENVVSPMAKTLVDADITVASKIVYMETSLTDLTKLNNLIDGKPEDLIAFMKGSSTVALQKELLSTYQTAVQKDLSALQSRITLAQRTYMQAQIDVFKEKTFFPDANSTLRVTFGKVQGYKPKDGTYYDFKTDLDGVMEKYKPGDYEFDVPEKLRMLHKNKDYGIYGVAGKMPVCFIATNHTTGGNSGSPALDAYGNLIGLNFDRVWEGTMSDINYDASICRNIMVDIRYVLFIVDKFAGADRLVKEMKLVHPKKRK